MTTITDNGFARITKETLVRDPNTSGALTGNEIAYNSSITINERMDSISSDAGKIPYTGALENVDLGVHNLTVDTNTLFVDSINHRLGVGTTTPTSKLSIESTNAGGNSGIQLSTTQNSASAFGLIDWKNNYSTSYPVISARISSGIGTSGLLPFLAFNVSDKTTTGGVTTERMRITNTGNVGIGNSAPSEKLDVTGNIKSSGTVEALNTSGFKLGSSASIIWNSVSSSIDFVIT